MPTSSQLPPGKRRNTAACLLAALLPLAASPAQTPAPTPADLSLPSLRWAEAAILNEQRIVDYDHNALIAYRVRKVDAKGETLRQVIESREGSVARLLQQNGQPLTPDANDAERARLQDILDSPTAFLRRTHREDGSRAYALELLRAMPRAMRWTYVPGQPQRPGAAGPAIVLDFEPDPSFKPPSLITEGLTGIAGRVWIDAASHCVTRIQGRILHPVDFGWGGVLARIREGGVIDLDQQPVSDRRWLYSRLVERITIREVLIHTVEENTDLTTSDAHPLPAPLSFREAVQQLLALSVPTKSRE